MPAHADNPYQYAVLRVVPHVERGECFNAGVVLLCRTRPFLAARVALDERKLAALGPDLDPAPLREHLAALVQIAAGEQDAGPIARLSRAERFHWITAPASTVIQPGPVHTGLCAEPAAELDHLFETLVGGQR